MDRFNLSQMVDKQLSEAMKIQEATTLFSNPLPKTEKIKDDDWEKRGLPNSIRNIMTTAHNHLKPVPKEATAQIDTIPANLEMRQDAKKPKKSGLKGKRKRGYSNVSLLSNGKSLPQVKASCQTKTMQNNRRLNMMPAHERTREIMHQKKVLEDMLKEHQKLQRDRVSIAQEIQAMKNYLSDIRCRLDASLRNLNIKHVMKRSNAPTRG